MARKGGGRGGKGGGRSDARDRFLSAGGALDLLSEAPAPQRARQREQGQGQEQQQRARKQQGKASKTASRRNALRESIKHNPIQVRACVSLVARRARARTATVRLPEGAPAARRADAQPRTPVRSAPPSPPPSPPVLAS